MRVSRRRMLLLIVYLVLFMIFINLVVLMSPSNISEVQHKQDTNGTTTVTRHNTAVLKDNFPAQRLFLSGDALSPFVQWQSQSAYDEISKSKGRQPEDNPNNTVEIIKNTKRRELLADAIRQRDPILKQYRMPLVTERNDTKHDWYWPKVYECDHKVYDKRLPTTSVIITFHEHESLVNILHTVHSLIQRTPEHLLKEIILVDDYSRKVELKEILENYVTTIFGRIVKILRLTSHVGLIQARLLGTREAKGEVLVVMDCHMEVQDGWLEPLLHEIVQNRKTLAASYLDWMKKEPSGGWRYTHGASDWKTYFDWSFGFGFQEISENEQISRQNDPTEPVETPVLVGTLFAIHKQYFREIGELDPGMQGWGGENLELPIRVWLCGGRVVNVPCSHAAHLEQAGSRHYRHTWGRIINENYRRIVEMWAGDFKKYFFQFKPELKEAGVGDMSDRKELRQKCSLDFSWYLREIFPQLGVPDRDGFAWGGLRSLGTQSCLNALHVKAPYMRSCDPYLHAYQGFYWSRRGELRLPMYVFNRKSTPNISYIEGHGYMSYYNTRLASVWIHWKGGPLIEWTSKLCLEADVELRARLVTCSSNNPSQQWEFTSYTKEYDDFFTNTNRNPENDFQYYLRDTLVKNGILRS